MAAIDFRQVAAPSFSDANALLKLASEQREAAFKGVQGTFDDAMGAVQNRNQAKMQELINMQTSEQLNDPNAAMALQEEFKRIGAATGNNYDPTVINTYLDGRKDTLLNREGKVNENTNSNIQGQQAFEDLQMTKVNNDHTVAGYEADKITTATDKKVTGVASTIQLYTDKIKRNPEQKDALMEQMRSHVASYGALSPEESYKMYGMLDQFSNDAFKQLYANKGLVNKNDRDIVNTNATVVNTDIAKERLKISQVDQALKIESGLSGANDKNQAALDAQGISAGLGSNERTIDANGTVSLNTGQIKQRWSNETSEMINKIKDPSGGLSFNEQSLTRWSELNNIAEPPKKLISNMNKLFNEMEGKTATPLSEAQKWKVMLKYAQGGTESNTFLWREDHIRVMRSNLPKVMKSVLDEEKNSIDAAKTSYYNQQFSALNSGKGAISNQAAALELGITSKHPDLKYMPVAVQNMFKGGKKAATKASTAKAEPVARTSGFGRPIVPRSETEIAPKGSSSGMVAGADVKNMTPEQWKIMLLTK